MSYFKIILHTFIFVVPVYTCAQNFVNNGSFEDGAKCKGDEQTAVPENWSALAGAPQFLNPNCPMSSEEKTYILGMKFPNPAAGKVFAGMGIDIEGEYIMGKLNKALEENTKYWVKIRVRLPVRFCNTPIDELGVVLTDSVFNSTEDYISINMPSIKLLSNDKSPISEQNQWQEISAVYTAKGGENHIIIGNFKDNNVSNFKERKKKAEEESDKKLKLCTYLFLDMVSVEEYKEIQVKNFNPAVPLKKGDRLILKDVEFETGLEKLKESSLSSLDALAKQLVDNSSFEIEISGHTDNTGDENTNRIFSKSRAQSVANYMVSKGVKGSQIKVEGKGSSMNITQNNSEANRKKNHRIEIKVIEE